VFVDANQATAARSATITVTGGGITRTLDLTQAGATVTDDPDDPELGIAGQTELWQQPAAATITINVTGNVDWTAAITAGSEFLTLGTPASGTGEGSFDIGLAQNTGAARAGTVTISATGVDPVIIGINQHELHTVSVDPSQLLNVPASGNTQAITVTSSTGQWEAEVTAGSDFIHLSGWDYVLQSTTTSGSSIDGNSALSIIVDGHTDEVNDRSGTVTVRCAVDGEASAYVTPILIAVTQVAYVAPPDNVNYVEINGVKWLKYNQAEAGVEPTEITVGVKFADVTTACPDGWRLPTWNEWAILATGSVPGSPWGIGNAKWTEKTTENGVTGVKHTDNNEFFLPIGENENTAYAATGDYTHIDFQKYEGNNVGWTGPAGTEPYYVRCVQ
jgi:uncharacterized protein (TIGR02145 family)